MKNIFPYSIESNFHNDFICREKWRKWSRRNDPKVNIQIISRVLHAKDTSFCFVKQVDVRKIIQIFEFPIKLRNINIYALNIKHFLDQYFFCFLWMCQVDILTCDGLKVLKEILRIFPNNHWKRKRNSIRIIGIF